jgi:hypothetical protein
MNSLPNLIDDKKVRTKEVRAFLDKKYATFRSTKRRRGVSGSCLPIGGLHDDDAAVL